MTWATVKPDNACRIRPPTSSELAALSRNQASKRANNGDMAEPTGCRVISAAPPNSGEQPARHPDHHDAATDANIAVRHLASTQESPEHERRPHAGRPVGPASVARITRPQ